MRSFPAIACCLLLVACGQTGPLYLPDHEPPKKGLSIRPDTRSPAEESPTPIPLPPRPAAAPKAVPAPAPAASVAPPPTPASPNP